VNKKRSHRFHEERFNLKKLNQVESKEQFRVEVPNRFAALEDLDAEVEINSACCETWSPTLREDRILRVFENRVLRRIFGQQRDEVAGE
jgi:hypothetical protein